MHLDLVTLLVPDDDQAVAFFVDTLCTRLSAAGVEVTSPPRDEPYGRVAGFVDPMGNRWDLLSAA
ncbi:VOC family protein [Mumia sp. zg.B21]|uniref:VOC family protein n=1 Tax=Mumia sp. zg.B21 TaxID=2855447 RepID=UPI001C6E5816|nr:VOC family protein [Mumia sp. zg.B21]MBW9210140.1 VOC family protein [Mumia sp. zg.B21]